MRQGLHSRRLVMGSGWYYLPEKHKVTGDGFVKVENGILKCKSNGLSESAYTYITFTNPIESYAEVMFEAKRVSGSSDPKFAGGVGYNQWSNVQPFSGIGGNLIDVMPIDSPIWKTYRFVIPGSIDKQFSAFFIGAFNNSIGEFWFRRLEINFYNHTNLSLDGRIARLIKESGQPWKIDRNPNGQACLGVYKVEALSNYLRVHYDPVSGWGNPIVQTTMSVYGGRYGWSCQPGTIQRTYADIYLYNQDGVGQNPATLTGGASIQFCAFSAL